MLNIAIIGAGIAGLASARYLSGNHHVTVFEKNDQAGGLARCVRKSDGSLFHTCGGQIMESLGSKTRELLEKVMDLSYLVDINKNNAILFENGEVSTPEFHGMFKKKMQEIEGVPNPIEKHIYMFKPEIQQKIIADIFRIKNKQKSKREPKFLATFLKAKFGETLYHMYFEPYNEKVWHSDLKKIPMSWLMCNMSAPSPEDILFSNFNHQVHHEATDSFVYNINGGPQGIIEALKKDLDIRYHTPIEKISRDGDMWVINGERFHRVVFCGNIRRLPSILGSATIEKYRYDIEHLKYHGTTSVFCNMSRNPYTMVYLPGKEHRAHRIICTGNLSESNNGSQYLNTGTIEFTDYISEDDIRYELSKMPLNPEYIDHKYAECTHPIQDVGTREMIKSLKESLAPMGFAITGRLAEWEFYNIEETIEAAIKTCENILND